MFQASNSASQTIRDQAEKHFDSLSWSEAVDAVSAQELPGKNVPGGNESFALMEPAGGSSVDALYPSYPGLGLLDYGEMDQSMLEMARTVSSGLLALSLDPQWCSPNKPWIPALANYRLSGFPEPVSVRFSAPDNSIPDRPTVVFSFRFTDNSTSRSVTITFSSIESQWLVDECVFEGFSDGSGALKN